MESTTGAPADANIADHLPAWPGAFHIFKYSKTAVMRNIGLLVLLYAVIIALSLIFGQKQLGFLGPLCSFVVGLIATVFSVQILVASVHGKKLKTSDLFASDLPMLTLRMIGLELLMGVVVLVSLLALIVPFFFVYPRLRLATYYLVDKNMGVFDAFKASWHATKGNVGKVWGIIGVQFLMILPMITVIGILLSVYLLIMYAAADAILYVFLSERPSASSSAV